MVAPVALAVIASAVSVARAARTTARVRSRLPMSAIAAAPRGRRAEHRRLAAALHAVVEGNTEMVAHPLRDSYHTVWFELHEELIRLTGRTRADEAAAGRA